MKNNFCPLCKCELNDGFTDLTFRREKSIIIVEQVPASVCVNCGEAVIDPEISQKTYEIAEQEIKRGVILEFVRFAA